METNQQNLKIPPHSIEAEQAVLGGLMLNNNAWDDTYAIINEQDFYNYEHRLIFKAIIELATSLKPLDVITLSEQLQHKKSLEEIGGISYLGDLVKNTPSAANILAYAEIVRERSVHRQLLEVSSQIANSVHKPGPRTTQDLLDEAEQKVFRIAEQSSNKSDAPKPMSAVFASTIEKIEELSHSNSSITGLATGFKDFDNITSGLQPANLVLIAARPSMGKTLLAMNIAEHAAMTCKKAVLVFSLEMPSEAIAIRMLSSLGRVDQHRIRTGQLAEEDWPRLTSVITMISEQKLLIDDTAALTTAELRTRARRVAREQGGLGLIVVDYLQLMHSSTHTDNRVTEISEISRSLKSLAKELDVPVLALSQLNRSLEQRPEKRPIMSDLRDSGALEQDADVIMFIYRDEVYNKETPEKGIAEIIIGKNRNGPLGMFRLTFLGNYARFENHVKEVYCPPENNSTAINV